MRKLFVLCLLLIFLGGCQLYLKEENSKEYQDLKKAYNTYLEKDIYYDNNFYDFINSSTLNIISSTVKIENNEKILSGVIFHKINNDYYVLSVLSNNEENYIIYDYKNIKYVTELIFFDEDTLISILKFHSTNNYNLVQTSERNLYTNEPVISTGSINELLNNMKLGLIKEISEQEIKLTYLHDYYCQGAPVFNTNLELIGLQKRLDNDEVVVMRINSFINYTRGICNE